MVAILERDEALSYLEEVAIRLVGGKVNIEDELAIGFNFLLCWRDLEWVLDELICRLVQYLKQSPIDGNREIELVLESQLSRLSNPAILTEVKVNLTFRESDVMGLSR